MNLMSPIRSMINRSTTVTRRERARNALLCPAVRPVAEALEFRRLLAATTPVDNDAAANTVAEGAVAGTSVGILATSVDPNGTPISYGLADDAGSRFGIDAASGIVTVANGSLLDGPATHTIVVEARDGAGGTASQSFSIAVTNVAPTLRAGGTSSVNEGDTYTLNLGSSDVGPDTIGSWTIDWGDGTAPQSVSGNPSSVTHVYADGLPRRPLGTTLLNELKVNAPGPHGPYEYAELRGDPGAKLDDLYFIAVEGDADAEGIETQGVGTAEFVVNLSGKSIGPSGLLAITATKPGYTIPADTTIVTDIDLNSAGSAMENGSNSFLLVSSPTPISEWTDYDADNDGVLELPAGAVVVDAVGWSDGGVSDKVYGGVTVKQSSGVPDAATRFFSDTTPSSAAAWFNGALTGLAQTLTYNTVRTSMNFPSGGALTPGASNVPATVLPPPRLNELKVNPPTLADNPYEYIELAGAPDQMVARLFFVSLESDATATPGGIGRADMVVNLSGVTFGSNGLLVIKSPTAGHPTAAGTAIVNDAQLDLSGGGLENGSNSFLLIATTDPILEGADYDANNDGVLELPPDAVIVDSVGWTDGEAGDVVYSGVALQQTGGGASHAASRFAHDDTPRSAAAWYNGALAGTANDSLAYDTARASANFPAGGALTPGDANLPPGTPPSRIVVTSHGYTIQATANDEDGAYRAIGVTVTVDDVAPTLAITGPTSINDGDTYSLNLGAATDPGTDSVSTYVVHWGDGQSDTYSTGGDVIHLYASGANTYAITVDLVNEDGTFLNRANPQSVTINTALPTITISGSASVDEGTAYTLNLSAGGTDTISSWTIDWGDGTAPETVAGNPSTLTHVYADGSNAYAISATATDGTRTFDSNALPVAVNNVAPSVAISGAATANEGSPYSLTLGAVTDPGTDTVKSYVIRWGDGSATTSVNSGVKTHTYADGLNTYNITVDLIDEDGTFLGRANPLSVTVNNVAPTLTISGAPAINEGGTYTLNLAASEPGADTISSWTINWGDGTAPQTVNGRPSSLTHRYADGPGTFTISATATDEDGTHSSNALNLNVNNVAPSVTARNTTVAVNEGQTATNTGNWSDPGADAVSLSASVGTVTKNANGTWSWSLDAMDDANQSRTVAITGTDSDGDSRSATFDLVVNNVAPTIASLTATPTVNEDGTVTLDGSFTDPGVLDSYTLVVNWGPGEGAPEVVQLAPGTTTFTLTHQYLDDDPSGTGSDLYSIDVNLTDKDGGNAFAAAMTTVNNVAPDLQFTGDTGGVRGQPRVFSGSFSDVGAQDTWTATVNYGDGTGDQPLSLNADKTFAFNHAYAATGSYTVTVTVTDDDGGIAQLTRSIVIKAIDDTQLDPDDPTKRMLVVGGTSSSDVIHLTSTLTGGIAVTINGALQGVFNPTGRVIVFGQGGDDAIDVGATITRDAEVHGGDGSDTLTGGGGTNLLLGGAGNDALTGGSARDVLIGGGGADNLNGGLAGDDLLIAGTTAYDANPTALRAIVKEWAGAGTYAQRVSRIASGAFYNGSVRLGAGTVFDDAATDILLGNLGDDWFLWSTGDTILDKFLNETDTRI